jgi:hypothetical protein
MEEEQEKKTDVKYKKKTEGMEKENKEAGWK